MCAVSLAAGAWPKEAWALAGGLSVTLILGAANHRLHNFRIPPCGFRDLDSMERIPIFPKSLRVLSPAFVGHFFLSRKTQRSPRIWTRKESWATQILATTKALKSKNLISLLKMESQPSPRHLPGPPPLQSRKEPSNPSYLLLVSKDCKVALKGRRHHGNCGTTMRGRLVSSRPTICSNSDINHHLRTSGRMWISSKGQVDDLEKWCLR
ncbi:uncharacterized protein BJX67DRAFT_331364 [Aspergillus lucknowensis]|uniref:Uncharacterized protein n=1 Tax=Aspergillus lucknowensis TaxID=176173 RepID=A0ABR4LY10_9EURO